jgi:hypothetical protein
MGNFVDDMLRTWECEGSFPHTPSHLLTLSGVCDVTPELLLALTLGLSLGPQLYNAFALTPELPLGP